MNGKRDWGWLLLVVILAAIFGLAKGCSAATPPAASVNPLDVLDELLTHTICLGPILIVLIPAALVFGGWALQHTVNFIFDIRARRLAEQRQQVEVALLQRSIPQTQILRDARGNPVLITPNLATQAVTPIAADAPQDSEQLRAVALTMRAARRGAVIAAAGPRPADLPAPASRRPELQIVDIEAIAPWVAEVRPQLAALAVHEEGSDVNY